MGEWWPCTKCGGRCAHSSGLCEKCRTKKCKRCGKIYVPSISRRSAPDLCGQCDHIRLKHEAAERPRMDNDGL